MLLENDCAAGFFVTGRNLLKAAVIVSLALGSVQRNGRLIRLTPSGDSAGKGGDISVARSGRPPGGLSISTRGVSDEQ